MQEEQDNSGREECCHFCLKQVFKENGYFRLCNNSTCECHIQPCAPQPKETEEWEARFRIEIMYPDIPGWGIHPDQVRAIKSFIRTLIDKVKIETRQSSFNEGYDKCNKENNNGRLMYQRGYNDGLKRAVEITNELQNKMIKDLSLTLNGTLIIARIEQDILKEIK